MTTTEVFKGLDERLGALERENSRLMSKLNRLRLLALALPVLGLAFVGLLAMESKKAVAEESKKAEVADAIDAKKIRILDNDGNVRIVLGTSKDKAVILLVDENGKRRSEWLITREGATLAHYTSTGKNLMNIEARGEGAVIDFKDLEGNRRLLLGMLGDEKKPYTAAMIMADADGNEVFYAPK